MRSFLSLLMLCACSVAPDVVEVSNLGIPTETVAVQAALNEPQTLTVILTNTGTAPALVRADFQSPVSGPASFTIDADSSRAIALTVRPDALADLDVPVVFSTTRQRLTLTVSLSVITDADGDGFPSIPAGGTDCDDTRASVFPGAIEVCNGLDDDCDGTTDTDAPDAPTWYPDADGDTWGADAPSISRCVPPPRHVARNGDCNDADRLIHPGRTERYYDGVDSDCDGASDFDADGDGFDSIGWGGTDCRDSDPALNPGAPEVPGDGVDQDCDGVADERVPSLGELAITEVNPQPGTGPAFVEITSRTASALALDQLAIVAATAAVLPRGATLEGFGVFVVCDSAAVYCDVVAPELVFDDVEDLRLGIPALDSVPLDDLPWSAAASAELDGPADPAANDDSSAWCTAVRPLTSSHAATPGIAQASCTAQ